jgi:hypothetical protein
LQPGPSASQHIYLSTGTSRVIHSLSCKREKYRLNSHLPSLQSEFGRPCGLSTLLPREAEMVGVQELSFAALGFICMIISWIKLRPIYAMWMTASLALFISVNFLQSIPRYTLTMFPISILFALLGRNRFWAGILTVWSLLFFALFAALFARGEWAF